MDYAQEFLIRMHVKNLSEKCSGSLFYVVFLSLGISFGVFVVFVIVCFVKFQPYVTFFFCLYLFAVVLV